MKPETEEWVEKAEGNWEVAVRELGADAPVWSVVCFLAQQCAELYLKAYLEEHQIGFRKTHNLEELHRLSAGALRELDHLVLDLVSLTNIGIEARYPGRSTDRNIAQDMMRIAGEVRTVIRSRLGLS
jgi:HEPN domain-containing protein